MMTSFSGVSRLSLPQSSISPTHLRISLSGLHLPKQFSTCKPDAGILRLVAEDFGGKFIPSTVGIITRTQSQTEAFFNWRRVWQDTMEKTLIRNGQTKDGDGSRKNQS